MTYPTSDILETEIDNVDDVMAQHVNELRGAASEMDLRYIKNTSGATVAVGAVGYIDEAGEFQTTNVAYSDVTWAVVIVGGVNNAKVVVAVGGSGIKVLCNGNAAVGDFLYTSTTVAQAQPQSYVRPEVMAVVTVANAAGAGGTCEALLHCNRKSVLASDANDVIRVNSSSDTNWVSTLNGAPVGAVVTYNVPLGAGTEDSIVPVAVTELAKFVLWNTSKDPDEYALIESVNTGANQITVNDAADVVGWLDTEGIQVTSTVVTTIAIPAAYDVQIEDTSIVPALAVAIKLETLLVDVAAAVVYTHPYEVYGSGKAEAVQCGTAGTARRFMVQKLTNRRFTVVCDASGGSTCTWLFRLLGYDLAVP